MKLHGLRFQPQMMKLSAMSALYEKDLTLEGEISRVLD